ncbi:14 kDa subunit of cytochrome bd ubiquinol oxidase [Piedraia hortae CBS 480.64]|uniref:Complex III subunit 7 n=1 Tax=Piedraia hortae CBS 480.64 TaxID=1314780 RepID=A0A6A7C9K8_9PEZI|nr:14 kDa subunit of cytochrome bd ubiquinol oxidase [Piedraia hortae CBS 480.64]
MSYPSLAPFVLKRPWLMRWMKPMASWYNDLAGYRKLGLKADDLIIEENETVQLALKRLSPQEAYDRVYRMRRAVQCSLAQQVLPRNEWTKDEDDKPYLEPLIHEIEAENAERDALDALVVEKPKASASH